MAQRPAMSPMRVVLVEDDADHAELVRRGLASQRIEIELTMCADAEAALERLRAAGGTVPHLILVDLRLPRMTGLQLLHELRASPELSAVPCVVLTTSEAEADVARARELSVYGYLVKPAAAARFAELIGEIERHWSGRADPGPRPA
jgi:CheY-like chemotaxis protein